MNDEKPQEPKLLFGSGPLDQALEFALKLLVQENAQSEEVDGRRYTKVVDRVTIFRRAFGGVGHIVTELLHADRDLVRFKANIVIYDKLVATGHAEEFRDAHEVNYTSALENAETSAIGRALANLGLHGGEFASADELLSAKAMAAENAKVHAVKFLKPEEVAAAVASINECKTIDQLAEVYMKLTPALKVAAKAAMDVKHQSLSSSQESPSQEPQTSAPTSGSEPAKAASPVQRLAPPSASRRRAAPSNGDA